MHQSSVATGKVAINDNLQPSQILAYIIIFWKMSQKSPHFFFGLAKTRQLHNNNMEI